MRNLETMPASITEGFAMNAIFDATRSNYDRSEWVKGDLKVSFKLLKDGEYEAVLRRNGTVAAIAIIDEFDC